MIDRLDVFGFVEIGQHVLEVGQVIAFKADPFIRNHRGFAGIEVVDAVASVKTNYYDMPLEKVVIKQIKIEE